MGLNPHGHATSVMATFPRKEIEDARAAAELERLERLKMEQKRLEHRRQAEEMKELLREKAEKERNDAAAAIQAEFRAKKARQEIQLDGQPYGLQDKLLRKLDQF